MRAGSITVTYDLWEDGDIITEVSTEGDLPLVIQLGLLEMAKDTLIKQGEQE
ncbi:hypothetical protein FDJ44_gp42 [Microbacterium phage Pikmin]|uniref:Uncharacterized protein n=3 Tax=Pikminvirus pikmin TaxID=2560596 RepID=A0A2P1CKN0_9CAUD|nr:hypothetical protein FDJ44_gp42 [Microbacterium phage Pikmin]AVJ51033.1 hypothetical protein PBI_PAJAZA_42 [Microbacterium phage Pajaza]AVJ51180.1 hypothetical protein PBI_PIKMIN_42 [Microbacterium phage Pikmin]AVJ51738.1 hypothetical protein PBI_CASEY_42 [Microbacterium phage Casey]